jgi:F0F1-type ATP synthase membrane subunit a
LVKKRNPIFVIVASFVTFFIYCIYWFYATRKELNELTKQDFSPILWTIGLFVPIVNLYVMWKYCEDVEIVSKKAQNKVILFLAWLVFFPIAQYLTQEELNKMAK